MSNKSNSELGIRNVELFMINTELLCGGSPFLPAFLDKPEMMGG